MIRQVYEMAQRPEFLGRVLFIEDYDMGLARSLIAGVDVWLNNPVYPLEASGTSGMKAGINGTMNLSVLDGPAWWAEGFDGQNGWAIPSSSAEGSRRDDEDARSLYEILQDDVVPLYYERDAAGLPEAVDRAGQAFDGDPAAGIQQPPHGRQLCRGPVPAGGLAGQASRDRELPAGNRVR